MNVLLGTSTSFQKDGNPRVIKRNHLGQSVRKGRGKHFMTVKNNLRQSPIAEEAERLGGTEQKVCST